VEVSPILESTRGQPARPVRVALYGGIILRHDAVSTSLLRKLDVLRRAREAGAPLDVTVFTQASDFDDPEIHVVPHLGALMRQRAFNEADVHIFEYGMWYELFNALFLIDRPSLVVDHNTTPPELVDDPVVEAACEKAIRERHNLHQASMIVTVSEFTRNQLVEMGLEPEKISVLHLPPNNAQAEQPRREFAGRSLGGIIELLYVGRLVKAKGVLDLLAAMDKLWADDVDLHLTFAGSTRFSQPDVLEAVDRAVARRGPEGQLTFVRDADDDEIARLYASSDVFVMPSHHEGYCVPVVEALQSGCFVIGSDAGNIPNVMGGLGMVYPVRDADTLAERISRFAARVRAARTDGSPLVLPTSAGDVGLGAWHDAVDRHLRTYSVENFDARFLGLVEELVAMEMEARAGWLTRTLRSPRSVLQHS